MFLDNLGHNLKDSFVMILILFTFILCAMVINLNQRLAWWDTKCDNCMQESNEEYKDNLRVTWMDIVSGSFIAIVCLFVLLALWRTLLKPALKKM